MSETLRPTTIPNELPILWNGGMAVNISRPPLAQAVNLAGEKLNVNTMGVVSGTALPIVMLSRIQQGDLATIREFRAFDEKFAEEIINEYIPKDGKRPVYPPKPETLVNGTDEEKKRFTKLAVAAAYVEVKLAKQGHFGPIGMNLLEKIQLMHLPTVLGAMMAEVDYLLVGAGIPDQFPKLLQDFSEGKTAAYNLDVLGLDGKTHINYPLTLDPKDFIGENTKLKKPKFYAIISHTVLAMKLADKVDGFVVEGPLAGGHNANPRVKKYDEATGRMIYEYGPKDEPYLDKILSLGKPVYLAGGASLKKARELGAQGIQVGSAFALTNENESGMEREIAEKVRNRIRNTEDLSTLVKTSDFSPTGFAFQVFQLEDTLSEESVYLERDKHRFCALGYLVQAFMYLYKNKKSGKEEEKIGFRCPAEPVNVYIRKDGNIKDTLYKGCLCEGLVATAGFNNAKKIVTLGRKLDPAKELILAHPNGEYSAESVVDYYTSQN